jgi:FKBP-type peptidyl-prolyl cis-trans isomerase FkpA
MTEITRVPIKPVTKGALTKLWLGVALAIALGAGLAWAAMPSGPRGLEVTTLAEGEGEFAKRGDVVFVKYVGRLAANDEIFDESQPAPLPVEGIFPEGTPFPMEEGATVDGFYEGLQQMKEGGRYELYIPSEKAYGSEPPPGAPIPPDADLIFEIEVIDIMTQATFERNLQILQQAIQSGALGGPGGPGGPGGAPGGGQ